MVSQMAIEIGSGAKDGPQTLELESKGHSPDVTATFSYKGYPL